MEVEIPNTDIEIVDSTDIEVITTVDVIGNVSNDLEITFDDNEYSIVGDDMVVMTNYDDAPQWLKDTIGNIVNIKTAVAIGDLDATKEALDVMLSELEVAKNTYELSIISSEDIDERITTAITTLNSSLREADATILQIAQTAVTPEEATAISINTLSASLSSNGTIGSAIHQLNVAMSTLENTTAESLSYLSSTMEGEINGNAEAMQTIRTHVGIDENGKNTGVGLLADVAILQKQNDGVIETYTGTYDVMIGIEDPNNNTDNDQLDATKEPYASWLAEDVANSDIAKRSAHVGDVYIKYSNSESGYKSYERAYKFIKTVVDGTSPYATDRAGFTWALVVDTDAQNAYVAALNAYDLADDKRRIFVGLGATSTPSVPYDQGDLWLIDAARTVNGYACKVGDILRCIESKGKVATYEQNDWVLASSYANAVAAEAAALETWKNTTYASTIATIQTQVDGKAETFYQSSIPTGRIKSINVPTNSTLDKYVGDLWKNTYAGTTGGYLGDNTEYIYTKTANGSNWNYDWTKMEVPDIVFDTIDTKKSIYSGNSLPVAVYPDVIELNDMWITGDTPVAPYVAKSIYVWSKTGSNPDRFGWAIPVRYTDDQYAKDIENGVKQITLGQHLNNLGWQTLSQVQTTSSATLASWVTTTYTADQLAKQAAIDGKIMSYFTSNNIQPYNPTAGSIKEDGDLWYDTSTKLLKRYVHSQLAWVTIEDKKAIDAAAAASVAQETADGKIITFLQNNMPTAISDEGDIWIDTDDFNHMYRADASGNWISVRDTANDNDLANAVADIAALEETNDGVVNSFYQTTAPTVGMSYGDWWIDTDANPPKAYRYEDTNGKNVGVLGWKDNSTHILGKAYLGAVGAQSTADGKIKTFYQSTIPTSEGVGDLWIDTGNKNKTYRAAIKGANEIKAGEWVRVTDESALDNFLISTYAKDLLNINNQIDGVAVTYFQSNIPYEVSAGTPANSGDVWYDTDASTPTAYKFVYKVLASDGVTVVSPSMWESITNTFVLSSLEAASQTKAAADRSIKNYTSTPTTPYYQGDTWMQGTTGDIYVCNSERLTGIFNSADWVIASKYTDDSSTIALQNGLANGTTVVKLTNAYVGTTPLTTYITSEVDSKINVYSGTTAPVAGQPSGVSTNDLYLWFTTQVAAGVTYDLTRTYKYSGSVWNEITTNSDIANLADLADGKRTVFSGSTVPVGAVERDIWIPSGNNGSYIKGEIYQYLSGVWSIATKYTADIQVLSANLQSQIDGKVDTYYQDTIPFANATKVAKKTQAGDYWYCTLTNGSYVKGKIYKYVESPNGSNYNYTWTENADVSKYVFDIADGKASIFTTASQPSAYKINDMMIVTTASFSNGTTTFSTGVVLTAGATRTSGFVPGDWTKKINDTEKLDAFVNTVYTPAIAGLQTQVDGQVSYYFYDSALGQTAASISGSASWTTDTLKRDHNGDIAYDTTLKVGYWYDRTTASWVQITGTQNAGVIEALKKAAAAKEAADNVIVSYYAWKQTTAPATQYKWMKDDNTLWEYVGSAWVAVDVKKDDTLTAYNNTTKDTTLYVHNGSTWAMITPNGIVANAKAVTDLNASLSSLGTTVSGHTSLLNTVDARIGTEGARVESQFAYDSTLKLTVNGTSYSYNSGFGIATSLTTGSGLPTGQSEFWIKADKFKLMSADGSKKSSYSPFTVDSVTGEINFNGKVSFNSVTNAPSISSNLLYNSEPSLYGGTKGYVLGYNDTGITAVIGQDVSDLAPSGSSSIYIYSTGTPAPNTVFDINSEKRTPIVGGKTYCAYAYFGAHRCTAQLIIGFYDAAGAIISYTFGNEISGLNGGKSLSNYGHSVIKVVAPSNAASVLMIYRGKNTTSANPYVFVVRSYLGVIDSVNSETPEWSEGTSVTYTPSNVVSDINNGNTTTINGGRITTGSVTANQINTTGLIAENISANEIVGKTITGGSISGAIIEGSIIKASYIDLNGQLKVLTDYIISVAMYNANPSLYIDAVYISVYNNYRIPTLSVVKESNSVFTNIYLAGSIYNGSIFSYSTANAGTLLKAQKIRPTVTVLENTDIISSVSYQPWWYNINYHVCNHFRLSLNGITLIEVHVAYQSRAGGPEGNLEYSVTNISGNLISPINITRHRYSDSTYTPLIYNLDLGIKDVVLQHTCTTGGGAGYGWNYNFNTEIKITLNSGTRIMPFDWTSGNIKFEQLVNANGSNSFTLKNIQITNLDL